jgi:hypothetical protein
LRRYPWVLVAVVGALAVAVLGATSVARAAGQTPSATHPHLAGTWSGKYGGAFSGTFTLRWTQSGTRLKGTIALSNPRGRYAIGGSVRGRAIRFGAVGVGATYTGSVSGTSMSGSYKSPQGGGTWSAHKSS